MAAIPQTVSAELTCVSPEPRTELFMLASAPALVLPFACLLQDLASYPSQHCTFLHWFHAMPLGRPLLPRSRMSALYFTVPPVAGSFSTLESVTGRIDILWVVPISEAERLYFKAHGADALEDLFESADIDLADPSRPSVA